MKFVSRLFVAIAILLSLISIAQPAWAEDAPQQSFAKARVQGVDKQGTVEVNGYQNTYQDVTLKILDGPDAGQIVHLRNGGTTQITKAQEVSKGQTVVLTTFTDQDGTAEHIIVDHYRLPWLWVFGLIFVAFVVWVTGRKGAGSLVGLCISLAVIGFWVAPQILHGHDPLLVSISGAIAILLLTTYMAHGISRQTTMAVAATTVALIITGILSWLAVYVTHMTGVSSDDIYSLQLNQATAGIDTRGLLLGGIIIGMVGALNDVTTTQAATVFALFDLKKPPAFQTLTKRSLVVGREHILSLVNTLVLAYAGSSLAIFILIVLNPNNQPLWVMINSETIFDEIIRTITGSFGLILAVPLVTFLTAWSILRKPPTEAEMAKLGHHHH